MRKFAAVIGVLTAFVLAGGCGSSGSMNTPPASGDRGSSDDSGVGEQIRVEGGAFTRISPEELNRTMDKQDLILVNTHIPFEGDLPGTDLSIPYNEIGDNLDKLPGKYERIVLYCRSGSMSNEAARTLVNLGYTNVWDLGGGMNAWEDDGFELVGV